MRYLHNIHRIFISCRRLARFMCFAAVAILKLRNSPLAGFMARVSRVEISFPVSYQTKPRKTHSLFVFIISRIAQVFMVLRDAIIPSHFSFVALFFIVIFFPRCFLHSKQQKRNNFTFDNHFHLSRLKKTADLNNDCTNYS